MRDVNQSSLAVLALTNRLVDVGVPPLKASEFWRVLDKVDDPARLLGLDEQEAADLTAGTGVEVARLVRLLDTGVGLAVQLEGLYEHGITAVTVMDEVFPRRLRERLGTSTPPVLYCAGEASLLATDGVGVVGSRDVGPEGMEVTRQVARQVAAAGIPLVSGGARGVDSISMEAAFAAGGKVVGVLADSLQRAIGHRDNRRAMLDRQACLCTPYRPDSRFSTGTAMGRNKIIYGLSRVTLVVASARGEGGTWSGATEAIKKNYGRVAVWMGAGGGPGNAALVTSGATPVEVPESVLDLDGLTPGSTNRAATDQMALTFESSPAEDAAPVEESRSADAEPTVAAALQSLLPSGAVAPAPTGICWCGCGKKVEDGAFFVPRHAPGASQRAVLKHFGSVEAFLALLGESPTPESEGGEPLPDR